MESIHGSFLRINDSLQDDIVASANSGFETSGCFGEYAIVSANFGSGTVELLKQWVSVPAFSGSGTVEWDGE